MKFCYKCGFKLSGNEKFCPGCGEKFQVPAAPVQQPAPEPVRQQPVQQPAPVQEPQQAEEEISKARKSRKCSRHGIIFTDLNVLSQMLGTEAGSVSKLLGQYCDLMAEDDIDYRVVDASDYKFVSKAAGKRGQKSQIHADSPWWDYQHILYDNLCYEKEKGLPESNYLFIIGGHEVIPVPVINHYIDSPRLHYKDIETDVLYGYPYGPHTQYALESTEIYQQEMYYLVGRLPVPEGVGIGYLTNYLQNAVNVRGGLPVRKIYAQCDPHWKELTAWLMSPFNKLGMLPDRSNISRHYSYGNVMLGPDVTSKYIHAVMEKDTDFIFLNLHGAWKPDAPAYYGEAMDGSVVEEIFPIEATAIPEGCNVLVTEACYGGRFIGYKMLESMMQTALGQKTVIGLASSRTAFGYDGPPGANADIMCGRFALYLLSGYCAADAMNKARADFFGEDGMLSPHDATTICEFNLYGDPSLRAYAVAEDDSKAVMPVIKTIAPKDFPLGYEQQTIKSAGQPQSLLEQVRGAVDANIMHISKTIGKELYEKYGLSPREPETIKRLKYKNGKQRLVYTYGEGEKMWVVTARPEGEIESILTSK